MQLLRHVCSFEVRLDPGFGMQLAKQFSFTLEIRARALLTACSCWIVETIRDFADADDGEDGEDEEERGFSRGPGMLLPLPELEEDEELLLLLLLLLPPPPKKDDILK